MKEDKNLNNETLYAGWIEYKEWPYTFMEVDAEHGLYSVIKLKLPEEIFNGNKFVFYEKCKISACIKYKAISLIIRKNVTIDFYKKYKQPPFVLLKIEGDKELYNVLEFNDTDGCYKEINSCQFTKEEAFLFIIDQYNKGHIMPM